MNFMKNIYVNSFVAILILIYSNMSAAFGDEQVCGHLKREFQYSKDKISLSTLKLPKPDWDWLGHTSGQMLIWDKSEYQDYELWTGVFEPSDKQSVSERGLFYMRFGIPEILAQGEQGVLTLGQHNAYVVLHSSYEHNTFASLYKISKEISAKKKLHGYPKVELIFSFLGTVAEISVRDGVLLVSGNKIDTEFAAIIRMNDDLIEYSEIPIAKDSKKECLYLASPDWYK